MNETRLWHPHETGTADELKKRLDELRAIRRKSIFMPDEIIDQTEPEKLVTYDETNDKIIENIDSTPHGQVVFLKPDTNLEEYRKLNNNIKDKLKQLRKIEEKKEKPKPKEISEKTEPSSGKNVMKIDLNQIRSAQAEHDKKMAHKARKNMQEAGVPKADDTQKIKLSPPPQEKPKKQGFWKGIKNIFKR
ncbi:MAG: hypothetical protein GF349_02470 [Candidatus Magasanikbacteria bacterium]|nr:hypothetical protein [Candidatus Magasanikbacteria bacterium]